MGRTLGKTTKPATKNVAGFTSSSMAGGGQKKARQVNASTLRLWGERPRLVEGCGPPFRDEFHILPAGAAPSEKSNNVYPFSLFGPEARRGHDADALLSV
jgi:hypothetical protein